MKCFTLFLLLLPHLAKCLSVVPQIATPHPLSSTVDLRRNAGCRSGRSAAYASRLFSATAISADDAYDSDGSNVNYGPSITLGKLKINLFGAIFGFWEVFWGVFYWYPAMTLYGLSRAISAKLPGDIMQKLDPFRRIPICIAYGWGLLSMTLFGMWPAVEGRENLDVLREVDENGKKGKLKPAMYVANHCSWMDIPFVVRVFGFKNCKMIAKAELKKVPILGRALQVAGHIMIDRTNRRDQMLAYKTGVQLLKDGVNLVTFPEGTRSKNSRMGSFKKGAFKMAQAVGASVVPLSIHYADKVQPPDYAFPAKVSRMRPKAVIKVGKPITTDGKTDDELLEEVWRAIADELPESQKPAKGTPMGVK